MSNQKKKKRKKPAHIEVQKSEAQIKKEKRREFLDNYLWLITFAVIIVLMAAAIVFIPKCTFTCADTTPPPSVSSGDTASGSDVVSYVRAEDGYQLQPPAVGEEIAVLETSMGTIKLRLFPNQAPLATENFRQLVSSGYYNGVIFHRVINNFMIQGGDADGMGGQSAYGHAFEDEFGRNLYNFRGALSMANAGSNTNGSQFFIVQKPSCDVDAATLKDYGLADWAAEKYAEIGGTWHLDGELKPMTGSGHTVFGQVFEGMDVVDAIAAVEVSADANKPLTDVTINNAYLTTYTM